MARIFCYVCKRHIEVAAEKREDQMKQFQAFGHSNEKVPRLMRGLVGVPFKGSAA